MSQTHFSTITFEPTQRCNLHCRMCYQHNLRSAYRELTFRQITQMLDQVETKSFWLIGGEIFCYSELFDLLEYASIRGWKTGLSTNGTMLDLAAALKLKKIPAVQKIVFSLDGTQETHNFLRNSSSAYQLALQAIHVTSQFTETIINMVLTSQNLSDLPLLLRTAKEIGVSKVSIAFEETYSLEQVQGSKQLLENWFNWQLETKNVSVSTYLGLIQFLPAATEWQEVLYEAFNIAFDLGIELSSSSIFIEPQFSSFYQPGTIRENFQIRCANAGQNTLRIDPEGGILGCGAIRKPFGNLLTTPLEEIQSQVDAFHHTMASNNYLPICTRCCKVRVTSTRKGIESNHGNSSSS